MSDHGPTSICVVVKRNAICSFPSGKVTAAAVDDASLSSSPLNERQFIDTGFNGKGRWMCTYHTMPVLSQSAFVVCAIFNRREETAQPTCAFIRIGRK